MALLFTIVVLLALIALFNLYHLYCIREVRKYGENLYLAGRVVTKTARGWYGVIADRNYISFSDYRLVTEKNPYGTVLALNRPKSQQSFASGNCPIRYLKKGETIFLIILEKLISRLLQR